MEISKGYEKSKGEGSGEVRRILKTEGTADTRIMFVLEVLEYERHGGW